MRAPLLTVLGGQDDVVPVQDSAKVYRSLVPEHLLTIRIVPGGDHRLLEPTSTAFAPGCLDLLGDVVRTQIDHRR